MRTRSYQVAALVYQELELLDVAAPLQVLSTAGRGWNHRPFRIDTVALEPAPVSSLGQVTLVPSSVLSAHSRAEIVILPGGYGVRRLLRDASFASSLAPLLEHAEHVLSIASGGLLISELGLLPDLELALPNSLSELAQPGSRRISFGAERVHAGKLRSTALSGKAAELTLDLVADLIGLKPALALCTELGLTWSRSEALQIDVLPAKAPVRHE